MKVFIHSIMSALFILSFHLNSLAQGIDTSYFALLHIYHPKKGLTGNMYIHLGDTAVYKSKYNSKQIVKLYKEGMIEMWVRPEEECSLMLDVKFGEEYFLNCEMQMKDEKIKPLLKLVNSDTGRKEYDEIWKVRDSLKALKELDTILRRNSFYAEIGGQAFAYSLNYDRLFRVNKKVKHSMSFGLELFPSNYDFYMVTPVSYNLLFRKMKRSYLELGIGMATFFYRYYNDPWEYYPYEPLHGHSIRIFLFSSPKIGWRFQSERGGLFFKIVFSPVINVLYYYAPMKYKNASQFNQPASYYFFEDWGAPWSAGPVLPWAGISIGYTFNFSRK